MTMQNAPPGLDDRDKKFSKVLLFFLYALLHKSHHYDTYSFI